MVLSAGFLAAGAVAAVRLAAGASLGVFLLLVAFLLGPGRTGLDVQVVGLATS
jgi:hypothetical protein